MYGRSGYNTLRRRMFPHLLDLPLELRDVIFVQMMTANIAFRLVYKGESGPS